MDKPSNNEGSSASSFPQPRTVPKGWDDTADLKSNHARDSVIEIGSRDQWAPAKGNEDPNLSDQNKTKSSYFESYFDMRPVPFGWDLDALNKLPR